MLARSSYPFSYSGRAVASNKEQLQPIFEAMVDELEGTRQGAVKVYTAAALRKEFGSVPAGVSAGEGQAYAVAKIGSDRLVLVLKKKFGAWRVIGMTR